MHFIDTMLGWTAGTDIVEGARKACLDRDVCDGLKIEVSSFCEKYSTADKISYMGCTPVLDEAVVLAERIQAVKDDDGALRASVGGQAKEFAALILQDAFMSLEYALGASVLNNTFTPVDEKSYREVPGPNLYDMAAAFLAMESLQDTFLRQVEDADCLGDFNTFADLVETLVWITLPSATNETTLDKQVSIRKDIACDLKLHPSIKKIAAKYMQGDTLREFEAALNGLRDPLQCKVTADIDASILETVKKETRDLALMFESLDIAKFLGGALEEPLYRAAFG
eukprot:9478316-Pyramimonas_sp.AAC.1